jgi:hypothetical protein
VKRLRIAFVLALVVAAFPMGTTGADALTDAGFSFRCFFSHRLPDDPIVYPGLPGQSHMHEFFGNETTDASSTPDTLRGGPTNCTIDSNSSGYWVPTLYSAETPVTPKYVNVYYRPGNKPRSTVQPFPAGLVMITGNAKATSPQGIGVVSWGCGANGIVYLHSYLPSCSAGYDLVLYIWFRDCWNGTSLDSPDHNSHMAYSSGGACPSGYPVPVPQLVLSVHYPIRGGSGLYLSSGGKYSGHADFMDGWDQAVFDQLVANCVDVQTASCKFF